MGQLVKFRRRWHRPDEDIDLRKADALIDRILDRMGKTRLDFEAGRIERSEWDFAHVAITGETIQEVRSWQRRWIRAQEFIAEDETSYRHAFNAQGRKAEQIIGAAIILCVVAVPVAILVGIGMLVGKYVL